MPASPSDLADATLASLLEMGFSFNVALHATQKANGDPADALDAALAADPTVATGSPASHSAPAGPTSNDFTEPEADEAMEEARFATLSAMSIRAEQRNAHALVEQLKGRVFGAEERRRAAKAARAKAAAAAPSHRKGPAPPPSTSRPARAYRCKTCAKVYESKALVMRHVQLRHQTSSAKS
mmetsp:Transcript_10527/g.33350  ORF Transcript_10527/g.33350 Transcript_10527/m.33350 type:complete len:182 (-) Transcript_10527:543-1088(-)